MIGWGGDVERAALDNTDFRRVLFTGEHCQLVVMCLHAGEEIGLEMHDEVDQFFRVERGTATVTMGASADDVERTEFLADGGAVIVPAGTWHNVVNSGTGSLALYTIYSPPNHPDGTVHPTKADADAAEAEHHH